MEKIEIFENQTCKDPELMRKFAILHGELVEKIVSFCKENNVDIDTVYFTADNMKDSIDAVNWAPGTDSCLQFVKDEQNFLTNV